MGRLPKRDLTHLAEDKVADAVRLYRNNPQIAANRFSAACSLLRSAEAVWEHVKRHYPDDVTPLKAALDKVWAGKVAEEEQTPPSQTHQSGSVTVRHGRTRRRTAA